LETEKNIFENLFISVQSQFKKYHPSGNLKLKKNIGIFQSLEYCILMKKKTISVKLKFT